MKPKPIAEITRGMDGISLESLAMPPTPPESGNCTLDCPECGGVGYVRYEVPVEHPKFGKLERCSRALARGIKNSIQAGQIDPRIGLTADEVHNLSWDMVQQGINQADRACEVTQRAYLAGHGLVFLYGGFGQGKSLVLKIAVAAALKAGKRAAYANLAGVLDDIRIAYDERENKMTELVRRMDWWASLDVLAIDELDKVGQTEWARERIFQLLDARYQGAVRQESLTVIAANHRSLDELSGYLRSRIEDNRFTANGYVLNLSGADARRGMPRNWKY